MASDQNKQIIIFKAPSDSDTDEKDAYCEAFESAGFRVTLVPVLDFEFCNLEELLGKLKNRNGYSGIIFTSPRCVRGIQLAVKDEKDVLKNWKGFKNFVVGESTKRLVDELGLNADGEESGNANALADVIIKGKYDKPFLYPTGSLTKETLKNKLKENGVVAEDIMIYKTKPHPDIEGSLKKIADDLVDSAFFIYFSPSGVTFTLPIIKEINIDLEKIKFVTIGPSTETALKEKGLIVAGTSGKPNPQSLLETINKIQGS